ncbi:hypothetical protein HN592_05525 [Candidatus Woesearchaeota archaeon]|nr:hypothetical protein [Candidatus Woesearchaeota archaeon]MBT4367946.1 hypothetical protein [Candidatus Woesearchaeota archaeon]MBT4712434.1 hypothetical protein [Candidatus Woesearchaeota archaeon]MBT7133519.1 hypothetical protein [Candidatus Woesearchaeota archaeon]MBT7441433.1 hypothetical protein [Candidatus Woesearchaeota archaeon]
MGVLITLILLLVGMFYYTTSGLQEVDSVNTSEKVSDNNKSFSQILADKNESLVPPPTIPEAIK